MANNGDELRALFFDRVSGGLSAASALSTPTTRSSPTMTMNLWSQ
jgi:hypothetical protein